MKMLFKLTILLNAFISVLTMAWELPEFELKELASAIKSNDIQMTIEQVNLSKHEQHNKKVSSYIFSLWEARFSDENLVLRDELVLINVANFLAQAHTNNYIEIDMDPIFAFARDSVNSRKEKVVSQALDILSRSSNIDDILVIFNIIKESKSEYLFNSSVLAVIDKCNIRLNAQLAELEGLPKYKRAYINSSISKFQSSGLCAGHKLAVNKRDRHA